MSKMFTASQLVGIPQELLSLMTEAEIAELVAANEAKSAELKAERAHKMAIDIKTGYIDSIVSHLGGAQAYAEAANKVAIELNKRARNSSLGEDLQAAHEADLVALEAKQTFESMDYSDIRKFGKGYPEEFFETITLGQVDARKQKSVEAFNATYDIFCDELGFSPIQGNAYSVLGRDNMIIHLSKMGEAIENDMAKDENRKPRAAIYAWDYIKNNPDVNKDAMLRLKKLSQIRQDEGFINPTKSGKFFPDWEIIDFFNHTHKSFNDFLKQDPALRILIGALDPAAKYIESENKNRSIDMEAFRAEVESLSFEERKLWALTSATLRLMHSVEPACEIPYDVKDSSATVQVLARPIGMRPFNLTGNYCKRMDSIEEIIDVTRGVTYYTMDDGRNPKASKIAWIFSQEFQDGTLSLAELYKICNYPNVKTQRGAAWWQLLQDIASGKTQNQ